MDCLLVDHVLFNRKEHAEIWSKDYSMHTAPDIVHDAQYQELYAWNSLSTRFLSLWKLGAGHREGLADVISMHETLTN